MIRTYTGKKFNPLDPSVDTIDLRDIAHALSNLCRFTGHTREFYSVAQHSLLVSKYCPKYPLWGLLHDASEAYLNDIAGPLKESPEYSEYRRIEERLMRAIAVRFDLCWPMPDEVHEADMYILECEIASLMHGTPQAHLVKIDPCKPRETEIKFLTRYASLQKRRANA